MWLHPPFFWMREPQPGHALVLRDSQDASRLAASARATRSTPSHSRACAPPAQAAWARCWGRCRGAAGNARCARPARRTAAGAPGRCALHCVRGGARARSCAHRWARPVSEHKEGVSSALPGSRVVADPHPGGTARNGTRQPGGLRGFSARCMSIDGRRRPRRAGPGAGEGIEWPGTPCKYPANPRPASTSVRERKRARAESQLAGSCGGPRQEKQKAAPQVHATSRPRRAAAAAATPSGAPPRASSASVRPHPGRWHLRAPRGVEQRAMPADVPSQSADSMSRRQAEAAPPSAPSSCAWHARRGC